MPTLLGMRVLYLEGDPNGMRFVSGTLTRLGVVHECVRPGGSIPRDLSHFQAVIVSDFPHSALRESERSLVRAATVGSLGVLMLGGWKSFGRGGWAGSDLANLLPVDVKPGDDRANCPSGVVLQPADHPLVRALDWSHPVVVNGFNRVTPREDSTVALYGRVIEGTPYDIQLSSVRSPLLVVRDGVEEIGGRTAALATDLAPHWSGGLTDWGSKSLRIGEDEEVGDEYAAFVMNLVRWVCGEDTVRRPLPEWTEVETTVSGLDMPLRAT
ncbi:MAG: glutamine amidotransferase [Myxococcales bacterium]